MNASQTERMLSWIDLFVSRGLSLADAQALVDKLVRRDREDDSRRARLEYPHLSGGIGTR
ncbi:hypothetical protein ACEN9J_01085 [Variovorax sp. Varisp41]|uniref:hypothetical protein n=1 Tax=Variovorax sp. Varisp41 TaxID=3243033 RepID=UPI0039B5B2E5